MIALHAELYLWIRILNAICIEIIEAEIDAKQTA